MLALLYTTFCFKKHIKTGFYVDYFFKLLAGNFVQNVFIWASLYVSEKFLIEYSLRYINNVNYNTNLLLNDSVAIFTFTLKWLLLGVVCVVLI